MSKEIPQIIKDVGFDFSWDEKKVWKLSLPVTQMKTLELEWHFDIPFLQENDGVYNLKPRDVIVNPEAHAEEYERTMNSDLSYPIDIMENRGRWLILDGLHRLMKAYILEWETVNVRVVPKEKIPEITN
ncbi:ParB N-terminal domain-containing protein [Candidatus Uhrbacteria bacterium]|nr:ParB N-terminal domain-containing protein [Candidatus Uhrbacteria bacterium]